MSTDILSFFFRKIYRLFLSQWHYLPLYGVDGVLRYFNQTESTIRNYKTRRGKLIHGYIITIFICWQFMQYIKKHETVNRDERATYRYQIPTIEYVRVVEYAWWVWLIRCCNGSLCSVNGEMRYLKMLWSRDEDVEVWKTWEEEMRGEESLKWL